MALPNSGAISFSAIQTEFGGSNPISLSEYYRGGGRVPNTGPNAAIAVSGTINVNAFHGAVAYVPDVTPDAFDFFMFQHHEDTGGQSASNTNLVTITGISEPITLLFQFTDGEINNGSSGGNGSTFADMSIFVDGSNANSVSWSRNGPGQNLNVTRSATVVVNNNSTLQVYGGLSAGGFGSGTGGASANVKIYNVSSSNTLLDSFIYSLSAGFVDGGTEV